MWQITEKKPERQKIHSIKDGIELLELPLSTIEQRYLQYVMKNKKYRKMKGYNRWEVFHTKGTTCVACKAQALHVVHWFDEHQRLDHYDVVMDNRSILTVDHDIPKCVGGSNLLWNLFPMCSRCNVKKSVSDRQLSLDLRKEAC